MLRAPPVGKARLAEFASRCYKGMIVHNEIEWEEIVSLARRLDRGVASHQGIDAEGVLRLARAVTSFQRRVTVRSGGPQERDPGRNGGEE